VGVLIAVGRGDLDFAAVQNMFDNPVPESWNPRAICVPPFGLYLLDVGYDPRIFIDANDMDEWNRPATLAALR